MILDVGDKKYAVHFAHHHNTKFDARYDWHPQQTWTTYCKVHEGICQVKGCAELNHPYQGVAWCNPLDQFSKKSGRKISLGRALQPLPRNLRQQIWDSYFKVCPHR